MTERRDFIKGATAALTTQIFTGAVKGANDRIAVAVIGMGRMGMSNLGVAMKQPNVEIDYVALVDAHTLVDLKTLEGDVLVAVAAKVGATRLIDNEQFREL